MAGDAAGRSPVEYLFFGVVDFICFLMAAESLNVLQYRRASEWAIAGVASILLGYYWPKIKPKFTRQEIAATQSATKLIAHHRHPDGSGGLQRFQAQERCRLPLSEVKKH
jgi:hypothetical protein